MTVDIKKDFPNLNKNLDLLVEECAEVIFAAQKAKRFGLHNYNPLDGLYTTNKWKLADEMGDVIALIAIVAETADIDMDYLIDQAEKKQEKLLKWYDVEKVNGPD